MNLGEKLLKFHFFFKAFVAYILGHKPELMISDQQADSLKEDWLDWNILFGKYTTPDTHNTASVSDLNSALEEFAPRVETVRTQIRDNTAIILSGTDRVNLDIKPLDKTKTKILPPDFAPSIGLVSMVSLTLTIFGFDPNHPAKKAKPKGAKFMGSEVAYTSAGASEPAPEAFSTRAPEGKTIFSILYPIEKVGMRIWVKCYYMSPTGKPGPKSVVFTIVLA